MTTLAVDEVGNDENNPIEPEYVGVSVLGTNLTVSTSGTLSCTGYATIKSTYYGYATWTLQKSKQTNNNYQGIATWTDDGYGYTTLSLNKTRQAVSGYKYRIEMNLKVYNSSGTKVDDITVYSPIVYYN
jgi:hypothetical protein